jgi:hypothetical protein
MGERESESTPSVGQAIERVLASGQRVLVDRIDLLRIEAKEDVSTAIRGAAFSLGGAVLLFYGWLVLVAYAVYLAWGPLPFGVALGATAAFHMIGGALLVRMGARTLSGIRPLRPDDPAIARHEERALSSGMRGAA